MKTGSQPEALQCSDLGKWAEPFSLIVCLLIHLFIHCANICWVWALCALLCIGNRGKGMRHLWERHAIGWLSMVCCVCGRFRGADAAAGLLGGAQLGRVLEGNFPEGNDVILWKLWAEGPPRWKSQWGFVLLTGSSSPRTFYHLLTCPGGSLHGIFISDAFLFFIF